jgi:NADH dehydrogenase FAD-containing subunit
LLRGYERGVQQLASSTLKQRGVEVRLGVKVTMLSEHQVHLADNTTHSADLVLWITGAEPSISLAESGLQVDRRGFVLVRETLQAVDDERIVAVGDSATLEQAPETPKAGVYAVRQSPVLYSNLLAVANGSTVLQRFHPQASYLSLLNCCDGTAILRYKWLKLRAGWAWRLKDRIDRRFMRRYQLLDPGLGTNGARPR